MDLLRIMRGLSNVTVFGLHITAIELCIHWNELDGVNNLTTSAQTIPLFLSVGTVLHVVFSHYAAAITDGASTVALAPAPTPDPVLTMEEAVRAARAWVPEPQRSHAGTRVGSRTGRH